MSSPTADPGFASNLFNLNTWKHGTWKRGNMEHGTWKFERFLIWVFECFSINRRRLNQTFDFPYKEYYCAIGWLWRNTQIHIDPYSLKFLLENYQTKFEPRCSDKIVRIKRKECNFHNLSKWFFIYNEIMFMQFVTIYWIITLFFI